MIFARPSIHTLLHAPGPATTVSLFSSKRRLFEERVNAFKILGQTMARNDEPLPSRAGKRGQYWQRYAVPLLPPPPILRQPYAIHRFFFRMKSSKKGDDDNERFSDNRFEVISTNFPKQWNPTNIIIIITNIFELPRYIRRKPWFVSRFLPSRTIIEEQTDTSDFHQRRPRYSQRCCKVAAPPL